MRISVMRFLYLQANAFMGRCRLRIPCAHHPVKHHGITYDDTKNSAAARATAFMKATMMFLSHKLSWIRISTFR